jgi:hypothetical protein
MGWQPPDDKRLRMRPDEDLRAYTEGDADRLFSPPPPERAGQAQRYAAMRVAAAVFARMIEDTVPPGIDRTLAIRMARTALNIANDGICFESEEESAYYAQRADGHSR